MANIAQTVNVLQAMVLTQEDQMLVTPTGHVYEMYAPHQGGTSVRALFESGAVTFADGQLPVVMGSASLKGKTLFVTLTNAHADQAQEVTVDLLDGAAAADCAARVLSGEIHAHNTFDAPDALQPQAIDLQAEGSSLTWSLPPASVLAAQIALR